MATNHTQNYQLNLWEPSDKFLREEINENSQKIDTALDTLTQTVSALTQPAPLLDFTLAADTQLITVPITAEYRQKYRKLLLYLDVQVTAEGAAELLVRNTDGKLADFYTTLYPRAAASVFEQEAFSEVIMELGAPVVLFFVYSHRRYRRTAQGSRVSDGLDHYSSISSLTWDQVSQIEIKTSSSTFLLAGGRVRMFGLL